jgi:cytochrome oxidase Cu insertion factor (SCO1/SenC/PrrC family)
MSLYPKARLMIALAATLVAAGGARAQQAPAAAAPSFPAPEVGSMAPDFTLPGATRYGLLRDPVHLSDYRGKTVVLAFFYRARTKG